MWELELSPHPAPHLFTQAGAWGFLEEDLITWPTSLLPGRPCPAGWGLPAFPYFPSILEPSYHEIGATLDGSKLRCHLDSKCQ